MIKTMEMNPSYTDYVAWPGCSKLGLDNPGLMRNLKSDMKA